MSFGYFCVFSTDNEKDQNNDDDNDWNIVEFLLWNWQCVEVNLRK